MARLDISLADLREDIAGAIPAELVLAWNANAKGPTAHARLLEPYRVCGTLASSDSAGLSRLTQRYTLAQVMKLVSEPKELIFAHGTAIGGEGIGVWAADNTQMFYPDPIDPGQVVAQMLACQRAASTLTVRVGFGIHHGECYRLAGGLFGPQADWIEAIAEDDTAGGEIVVSEPVLAALPAPLRAAARRREDLAARGALWSLTDYQGPLDARPGERRDYPTPFDRAFFDRIRGATLDELAADSLADCTRRTTVAFVKVAHGEQPFLLDQFTAMSLVDLSIRRVAAGHRADVVKSTGTLAIVLFDDDQAALAFARDVIETTRALGTPARVGLARGDVLLFPLQGGGRDIAGQPVNIGSKLAEDSGLDGILVEDSLGAAGAAGEPFSVTISRVEIRGRRIPA